MCKNESSASWNIECEIKFSGLGSLKEHIRKGNSENVKKENFGRNFENSQMIFSFNNEPTIWSMWGSYKDYRRIRRRINNETPLLKTRNFLKTHTKVRKDNINH